MNMELKEDIGCGLEATFEEAMDCISVSSEISRGDTIYLSAEAISKLAAFSQRIQCELASRQNFSLPEIKPIKTVLAPAPKH